ncbi:MAG: NosD domain-containing protein [Candidatus Thorarchaeota archaeon]
MKRLTILLIVMMTIGLVTTKSIMLDLSEDVPTTVEKFVSTNLNPHDDIAIFGDDEFTSTALAENWVGNGSESGPYIIEGYEFSTTDVCLGITNTSSHFIIRNCSFTRIADDNLNIGLQLANLTNGVVTNCSFSDLAYGISIKFSENCTMVNSMYTGSRWYGINTWLCEDLRIEDNTVIGGLLGINLRETIGFCSIKRNTFINSTPSFSGDEITYWIHDLVDNTVNGLPIAYFYNITNTIIDLSGYGSAIIFNCSEIVAMNGFFVNATVRLAFASNCTITGIEGKAHRLLVSFYYASNCTLQDSTFDRNFNALQLGSTCENCTIRNCTIFNTLAASAIYLNVAKGTKVINNTIVGLGSNNIEGIDVSSANYTTVVNNSIIGLEYGIRVSRSYNCNISGNTISNNTGTGCYFSRSGYDLFINNTISHNSRGVAFSETTDCTIELNTILNNENDGIDVYESMSCILRNNTINWNGRMGVWLHSPTSDFAIYDNIIGWNGENNAQDDGSSNMWDDGVSRGNRWSDYSPPPSYYLIPGSAGSQDRYPSIIADVLPPIIIMDHTPEDPTPEQNVTVTAQIYDTSEISTVILSYSKNMGLSWTNVTMVYGASEWTGEIPKHEEDIHIYYKVYASDVLGYWAWSLQKAYAVVSDEPTTTTETTTTDTTTTEAITSTSSSTDTNGTTIGTIPSEMILIISAGIAGVVLIVIVIIVMKKK